MLEEYQCEICGTKFMIVFEELEDKVRYCPSCGKPDGIELTGSKVIVMQSKGLENGAKTA